MSLDTVDEAAIRAGFYHDCAQDCTKHPDKLYGEPQLSIAYALLAIDARLEQIAELLKAGYLR